MLLMSVRLTDSSGPKADGKYIQLQLQDIRNSFYASILFKIELMAVILFLGTEVFLLCEIDDKLWEKIIWNPIIVIAEMTNQIEHNISEVKEIWNLLCIVSIYF